MEGNIAHAFARKWPDVWREIEDEIPYPLGMGEVFDYKSSSEGSFRLILIASTLTHKDTAAEPVKRSIVRTTFERNKLSGRLWYQDHSNCHYARRLETFTTELIHGDD